MSPAPLTLEDVRLEREAGHATLAGAFDGHRLFWTMRDRATVERRGEPFVAATLGSAMRAGRDLVLPDDLPIDAVFLKNLERFQEIFARWFSDLRPIGIHGGAIAPRHAVAERMTGYSGGVDSSFTVMRLAGQLDGVALLDGIDYGEPNPSLMARVTDELGQAMHGRGIPLITVQTNAKPVAKRLGGKWSQFIGGTLASLPHAVGLSSYAIAGSNSWENARPYGTHPVTDPLYSSSQVTITHHGADYRRIDKIAELAAAPDLLAALRVCFQGNAYNCGTCQKCLQTAAGLRALQLVSADMPPLNDPTLLRRAVVEHDGDRVDWAEILSPQLRDRDKPLYRELRRLVRRYDVRQLIRRSDEVLLDGWVRRTLIQRTR